MRIIFKTYEHLQTMTRTSVKFQNNWHKAVRGVAHTIYLVSIHLSRKSDISSTCEKSDKNNLRILLKTICTSSDHDLNICKVSKESALNCRSTYTR